MLRYGGVLDTRMYAPCTAMRRPVCAVCAVRCMYVCVVYAACAVCILCAVYTVSCVFCAVHGACIISWHSDPRPSCKYETVKCGLSLVDMRMYYLPAAKETNESACKINTGSIRRYAVCMS